MPSRATLRAMGWSCTFTPGRRCTVSECILSQAGPHICILIHTYPRSEVSRRSGRGSHCHSGHIRRVRCRFVRPSGGPPQRRGRCGTASPVRCAVAALPARRTGESELLVGDAFLAVGATGADVVDALPTSARAVQCGAVRRSGVRCKRMCTYGPCARSVPRYVMILICYNDW